MIALEDAVDGWLAICATRVRAGTLLLQRLYLRQFAEWAVARGVVDLHALTRDDVAQYQVYLRTTEHRTRTGMKKLADSSRCERFSAVRRFLAWAAENGELVADPAASMRRESRTQWQPANVISESDVVSLLDAPDESIVGLRDRALLELLYSTGLRCAEVSALDLGDVDLTEGIVFVRNGKGAKQRIVPIGSAAIAAMRQYLIHARPFLVRHPNVRAVFVVGHCRGKGLRLRGGGIRYVIERVARRAGVTRRVTPHTFRHSFATHVLRAGADLRHVQELLGHSRIDATERYTHLDVSDLAAAPARSHPRGKTRI